jgi:hypothetical protein
MPAPNFQTIHRYILHTTWYIVLVSVPVVVGRDATTILYLLGMILEDPMGHDVGHPNFFFLSLYIVKYQLLPIFPMHGD